MRTRSKMGFRGRAWCAARDALALAGLSALAGCGGDSDPKPAPSATASFTLGGSVSGLEGTGLVLRAGGTDLPVSSNGGFSFPRQWPANSTYEVVVATQPSNQDQNCAVTQGTGVLSVNTSSVLVTCESTGHATLSTGGSVELAKVARVEFPSGSLDNAEVRIEQLQSEELQTLFDETVWPVVTLEKRGTYQVAIKVTGQQPAFDTQVRLTVPKPLQDLVAAGGGELRVFYNMLQTNESDTEEMNTVRMLPERFESPTEEVLVSVSPAVFAPEGDAFIATLYLAVIDETPGDVAGAAASMQKAQIAAAAAECGSVALSPPVEDFFIGDSFGERMNGKKREDHGGTDFPRAKTGTSVRAMAAGTVVYRNEQYNKDTKRGWGWAIILQHADGSTTTYAHLKDGTLIADKATVVAGQEIAKANATGGVRCNKTIDPNCDPSHLHVEYRRPGKPVQDVIPCITLPMPPPPTPPTPPPNDPFVGAWTVRYEDSEGLGNIVCSDDSGYLSGQISWKAPGSYTLSLEGAQIGLSGTTTLSGSGSNSYAEDGGTTTLEMAFTVTGSSLSGYGTWRWVNGNNTLYCEGSTTFSGSRSGG